MGLIYKYHKILEKPLNLYVQEFASRHNVREQDTLDQMANAVWELYGKQLIHRELVS